MVTWKCSSLLWVISGVAPTQMRVPSEDSTLMPRSNHMPFISMTMTRSSTIFLLGISGRATTFGNTRRPDRVTIWQVYGSTSTQVASWVLQQRRGRWFSRLLRYPPRLQFPALHTRRSGWPGCRRLRLKRLILVILLRRQRCRRRHDAAMRPFLRLIGHVVEVDSAIRLGCFACGMTAPFWSTAVIRWHRCPLLLMRLSRVPSWRIILPLLWLAAPSNVNLI